MWRPRQFDGVRLTWDEAEVVLSGYPQAIRFEDGVVVELAPPLTEVPDLPALKQKPGSR